jgi:hypothetical protein
VRKRSEEGKGSHSAPHDLDRDGAPLAVDEGEGVVLAAIDTEADGHDRLLDEELVEDPVLVIHPHLGVRERERDRE